MVMLNQAALEAALNAAGQSAKTWVRDELEAAIVAYLSALTPAEAGGLVERLRVRWEATDEPTVKKINRLILERKEAADALEAQAAELSSLRMIADSQVVSHRDFNTVRAEKSESDLASERAAHATALSVLRDHHRWHTEAGEVGLPDGEGGWISIDLSAEYGDSRIYERTAPLIDRMPPQERPTPRGGAGSNHWENWVLAVRRLRATESRLAEALKALEPFAKAAEIKLCGEWRDDQRFAQTDVGFHLTFGHLRAARRVREGGKS